MEEKGFKILFYEKDNGEMPALSFIKSLNKKFQAKIIKFVRELGTKKLDEVKQYSKKLDNNIYEFRIMFNSNYVRLLYFFYENKIIVLTSGFLKKTNKTPISEIYKANMYRIDWLRRKQNEKE